MKTHLFISPWVKSDNRHSHPDTVEGCQTFSSNLSSSCSLPLPSQPAPPAVWVTPLTVTEGQIVEVGHDCDQNSVCMCYILKGRVSNRSYWTTHTVYYGQFTKSWSATSFKVLCEQAQTEHLFTIWIFTIWIIKQPYCLLRNWWVFALWMTEKFYLIVIFFFLVTLASQRCRALSHKRTHLKLSSPWRRLVISSPHRRSCTLDAH